MSPAPLPEDTSAADLELIVAGAAAAAAEWAAIGRPARARTLVTVAHRLETAVDELVPLAQAETHLAEPRLRGELTRTAFQLRLFAEVLHDGAYLEARIDQADDGWPMGAPRPDLRRILEPLGPVVVFAAGNFPFAFSVAGGDTASALAAGCPVVLKAHPGHLGLSAATAAVVTAALAEAGAPAGTFGLVYGEEAGRAALTDRRVTAGAFTGSLTGGRVLFDLAAGRPEPIPFYGELGSLNPVFVTRRAAAERAEEIVDGFVASFTLGAGQFCTKPGVLLVPADSAVPARLAERGLPGPVPLLSERIAAGFSTARTAVLDHPGVTVLAGSSDPLSPTVLVTEAQTLLGDLDTLFVECFGPSALLVTYREEDELLTVADAIGGQLTATICGHPSDQIAPALIRRLASKAGRVLWNQWPTGVSVTYAQQHGGPYPATTAPASTSVGTAAISRFLRPVAYQGFPPELLPAELVDMTVDVPRQISAAGTGGGRA